MQQREFIQLINTSFANNKAMFIELPNLGWTFGLDNWLDLPLALKQLKSPQPLFIRVFSNIGADSGNPGLPTKYISSFLLPACNEMSVGLYSRTETENSFYRGPGQFNVSESDLLFLSSTNMLMMLGYHQECASVVLAPTRFCCEGR